MSSLNIGPSGHAVDVAEASIARSAGLAPLRFGILSAMAKSPAHARYALEHGREDTAAMRLGRLAHAIALGTPIGPVWTGERRAGKEWTAFKEAHEGEDIVTAKEFDRASAMGISLAANPEAFDLLQGIREETVLFDYAGRPCRTTPDVRTPKRDVELKTTTDASPRRFPWIATGKAYQGQMAFQKDGLIKAGLATPELELWIVAIETGPPFAVGVYRLTKDAEDFGRRTYVGWMEDFLNCERSGVWPSYGPGVLDAPEDGSLVFGEELEEVEA